MGKTVVLLIMLSVIIKQSVSLYELNNEINKLSLSESESEVLSDNALESGQEEEVNEAPTDDSLTALRQVQTADVEKAKSKADLVKFMKGRNNSIYTDLVKPNVRSVDNDQYALDPILNFVRRRNKNSRRKNKLNSGLGKFRRRREGRRRGGLSDMANSSSSESSSLEMKDWKREWSDIWREKQLQALNQSKPGGDTVNMALSRPWGVACGDPNQHDLPWGTCMLAIECESEYRIYRGDYFCGRTTFVCCGLQVSTYDLYQGFDVSFDKSTWETDSEERKRDKKESKKKKKHKKNKNKKRKLLRKKRKKKIIKTIKKILIEMRNFLNKQYRNGTKFKRKRTNQLKKFIKALKRKYVKDRQSVKDIHEMEIMKVDYALMQKLNQILKMNKQFMNNGTYRDIIVNGTISKSVARMLAKQHPELKPYFHFSTPLEMRRSIPVNMDSGTDVEEVIEGRKNKRRKEHIPKMIANLDSGNDEEKVMEKRKNKRRKEYLFKKDAHVANEDDYETEYGLLYY